MPRFHDDLAHPLIIIDGHEIARSTNEMQLTRISQVEKERRGVASLNSDLRPVKNRILSPRTTNPFQCISSSRPFLSLIVPSVRRLTLVLPSHLWPSFTPVTLSLSLSHLAFCTSSSLPPSVPPALPPFSNHLTFHRPSVSCPFLPHYPLRFAPVSLASFLRRPRCSSCSRSRCRFNKCPVTLRKYRT